MFLRKHSQLLKENPMADNIPYQSHVTEDIVSTNNAYLIGFKLSGIGFENADDDQLNGWHERLNVFLRNIAKPNISIWHTIVRHRETRYPNGEFPKGFANDLNEKYHQRVAHEILMDNDIYLAIAYRPQPGRVGNAIMKYLGSVNADTLRQERQDAIEECEKLQQHVMASLGRYDPDPLGIYKHNGKLCSSLMEYFGLLTNGEWQRFYLPRAVLSEALATSRVFFGAETMEYRTATQTRMGAFLGIKEYPTPTVVGMFNKLLTVPFSFIQTQSFTFINKSAAQGLLGRHQARMHNFGDLSTTQADEIDDALDQVTSNQFVMGDHHYSLQVLTEPHENLSDTEILNQIRQLNANLAVAKTILADTGMTVAREDLANEAAFWAQLPGNFMYRPRLSPITSRNFAAMAANHNYPEGRLTGNHWGDAMAVFITNAKSNYYFSLHASDPKDPTGGSKKDVAHTFVCGQTGIGKTVTIGFLICMLLKQKVTQVIFDKDYGLEILIRALGGCYLTIENKKNTGLNPLQLEPTPNNVEFISQWLRQLVYREDKPLTESQRKELELALQGTLKIERQYRRLSRLVEFLSTKDPEGLYARLSKWCEATGGEYAWVFDNETDSVTDTISKNQTIGFDITNYIDNPVTRTPITLYLFHLVNSLMDGRPLIAWMEEFSKSITDKAYQEFSKDGLQTARKKNGGFVFITQSPSAVIESPIASAIAEQTATKIFLPNEEAKPGDYIDYFGLSEREFLLIKEQIEPGSRQFLIKQGHNSVVCELNLKGFDFELDVISGRTQNVKLVREIIAEVGENPDAWLPIYKERRLLLKEPAKTTEAVS
ncbi:Type IV secretion system protein virB4 [biofilm metagenome]